METAIGASSETLICSAARHERPRLDKQPERRSYFFCFNLIAMTNDIWDHCRGPLCLFPDHALFALLGLCPFRILLVTPEAGGGVDRPLTSFGRAQVNNQASVKIFAEAMAVRLLLRHPTLIMEILRPALQTYSKK
jgi:hypothetical protein